MRIYYFVTKNGKEIINTRRATMEEAKKELTLQTSTAWMQLFWEEPGVEKKFNAYGNIGTITKKDGTIIDTFEIIEQVVFSKEEIAQFA